MVKVGVAGFMLVGRDSGIQMLGYDTTLEKVIEKTADLKMDGIELGDAIGPDNPSRPFQLPDKAYRKKIREMIESKGLELVGIQSNDRLTEPLGFGSKVGRPTLMMAQYRLQLASDLGCDTVRVDLWESSDRTRRVGLQYAQARELIKEYVLMAEDYGITLAIHNHGWLSIENRAQMIKDCGSPKSLKLQLDVVNCANRGEDVFEVTRKYKDLLCGYLHVKGQRVMFEKQDVFPESIGERVESATTSRIFLCNIGDGNILNWEDYLKLLKEINYDGHLIIESYTDKQMIGIPDWESYEKGAAYLRNIGKRIGY